MMKSPILHLLYRLFLAINAMCNLLFHYIRLVYERLKIKLPQSASGERESSPVAGMRGNMFSIEEDSFLRRSVLEICDISPVASIGRF